MTEPRKTRRLPGSHPRRRRHAILLLYAGALGCFAGLVLAHAAAAAAAWLDVSAAISDVAAGLLVLAAAACLWAATLVLESGRLPPKVDRALRKVAPGRLGGRVRRWVAVFDRYGKGEDGEVRVWESVDDALYRPGCAAAYSEDGLPGLRGDVDHLVATPARLWVVDAKYRDVPKSELPEALLRVAAQVEAVEAWAPPGTPVRGCMVLAYRRRDYVKETYTRAGDKEIPAVWVFDRPERLADVLRREAAGPPRAGGEGAAAAVRDLAAGRPPAP